MCTIDVVGLYPNIPHDQGLFALRKLLDLRQEKDVTTSTLAEEKQDTAISTKFALPYNIFFMAELEEGILSGIDLKP